MGQHFDGNLGHQRTVTQNSPQNGSLSAKWFLTCTGWSPIEVVATLW